MPSVALGLGSNLGDSLAILRGALADLRAVDGLAVTGVSGIYETDPVGGPEQPVYLNAVVVGETDLPGARLLAATGAIEQAWRRERDVRWGPRTLDIDILALGEQVSHDPVLTLPHPRAHERAFVLVPWHDVDAAAVVPGRGPVAALLAGLDATGVRPTGLSWDDDAGRAG